ncbi:hypothetical protein J3D48_006175 [Pseudomonas fluorescens]|nr:hypothetical protein [Pseudomonas fluorescens]
MQKLVAKRSGRSPLRHSMITFDEGACGGAHSLISMAYSLAISCARAVLIFRVRAADSRLLPALACLRRAAAMSVETCPPTPDWIC